MLTLPPFGLALLGATVLAAALAPVKIARRPRVLAAALLLALAGAIGVRMPTGEGPIARLVLLDVSESTAGEGYRLLGRSRVWLEDLDGEDRLGVILFAGRPVPLLSPTRIDAVDASDFRRDHADVGSGTDLPAAFDAAGALLAGAPRAEVVVHTDGRSTREGAERAVRRLRDRGVHVAIRPLGSRAMADLRVIRVSAPASARPGERTTILVDVAGPPGAAAVVGLRGPGDSTEVARTIRLGPGGRARAGFSATLPESGPTARFAARVRPRSGADPIPANDRGAAIVALEGSTTVWAIVGEGGEPRLAGHLADAGMRVTTLPPDRASLAHHLQRDPPDLVLLEDLPARQAPAGLGDAVAGGTGLLVVGGVSAFGPGGYAGHDLERLLPLRSRRDDDPGLAVVLLVDVSGSMNDPFEGSGTRKCVAARRAVSTLLRALPGGARFALVPFADAPREPTALLRSDLEEDRQALEQAVMRLDDPALVRGGTELVPALDAAVRLVRDARGRRHVVVVSDGEVGEGADVRARIATARDALLAAGSTIGVVATGSSPAGRQALEALVEDPASIRTAGAEGDLVEAFLEDLRRKSGEGLRLDGPAAVRRAATARADDDPLPSGLGVDAWLRTWLRDGSRVVLEVEAEGRAWPILARGRHGLGRVAAVPTSPGRSGWIGLRWRGSGGEDVWTALVRSLARAPTPPGVVVEIEPRSDGRLTVVLVARDGGGRFRDLDRPRFADGTPLVRAGAGRWQTPLDAPPPGTDLLLRVIVGDGRLLATRAVVPPLPPELTEVGPDGEALARLRAAAEGPTVVPSTGRNVSWILLLLAAALVVLEAALGLRRGRVGAPASA